MVRLFSMPFVLKIALLITPGAGLDLFFFGQIFMNTGGPGMQQEDSVSSLNLVLAAP